jgi:hypothetical protein
MDLEQVNRETDSLVLFPVSFNSLHSNKFFPFSSRQIFKIKKALKNIASSVFFLAKQ